LVSARAPSSLVVAFRFAMMVKTAVGRGRRREKEGEGRSGKARVADQTADMTEQASTPSSICLSDPQGRDEVVAQEGVQK
jgi:hypothetical protein